MTEFGEEAGIVVEYLKAMNLENERAMRVHQKMLQESIDYMYEVRGRNAITKDVKMSIREALVKLQNVETVKKLRNPEKVFKELSSHVKLDKIFDEDTRLLVGALINIGSVKTDHSPISNSDLINESVNRLLKVHRESNQINKDRDMELHNQLHDALSMINVVDCGQHGHDDDDLDTVEWVDPSMDVPPFIKEGKDIVTGG